jgi:nicotinamide phosphoribosyltransferase
MSSYHDAAITSAAHLTSFWGTDTIPGIELLEKYYNADIKGCTPIGVSIAATEHSVMSMSGKDEERETFRRLIVDLYPKGPLAIVSDTWDLWNVIDVILPSLKNEIMSRDGKVVIRPDSGDPYNILCGEEPYTAWDSRFKGAVECLWDIFGGTITETGHKLLDSHIGLIYGDSITLEKAERILKRLDEKGFASGNIVFGVGSFTYQYNTRDTYGFAIKSTSGVVNGKRRDIYKDPATDDGRKKSAKGLLRVEKEGGKFVLYDNQTELESMSGELRDVFLNGSLKRETSLKEIRNKLSGNKLTDGI